MTDTEKMNAYIWAAKMNPVSVPLLDLKKGDKFLWACDSLNGTHIKKTYCGKGWYLLDGHNRKARAGTKTAVIRIA